MCEHIHTRSSFISAGQRVIGLFPTVNQTAALFSSKTALKTFPSSVVRKLTSCSVKPWQTSWENRQNCCHGSSVERRLDLNRVDWARPRQPERSWDGSWIFPTWTRQLWPARKGVLVSASPDVHHLLKVMGLNHGAAAVPWSKAAAKSPAVCSSLIKINDLLVNSHSWGEAWQVKDRDRHGP